MLRGSKLNALQKLITHFYYLYTLSGKNQSKQDWPEVLLIKPDCLVLIILFNALSGQLSALVEE